MGNPGAIIVLFELQQFPGGGSTSGIEKEAYKYTWDWKVSISLYPPNQAQTGGFCYWWCRKLWLAEVHRSQLAACGEGARPFPTAWLRVSGNRSNNWLETKKEPFIWLLVEVSDKTHHPLARHLRQGHPQGRCLLWDPWPLSGLGRRFSPHRRAVPSQATA